MPKGTCKEGSYWICFIKMNELKTKSYLAEFDVQHKTFCRFSEYGTFKLGVKEVTSTSFEVDHLKTSSIWPSNQGNCLQKAKMGESTRHCLNDNNRFLVAICNWIRWTVVLNEIHLTYSILSRQIFHSRMSYFVTYFLL